MLTLRLVLIKKFRNLLTEIAVADSRCDVSWSTDRDRGKIMSQWILMWQKNKQTEETIKMQRTSENGCRKVCWFVFFLPSRPALVSFHKPSLSLCQSLEYHRKSQSLFFPAFLFDRYTAKTAGIGGTCVCVLSVFVLVFCVQSNMRFVNLSEVDSQVVPKDALCYSDIS